MYREHFFLSPTAASPSYNICSSVLPRGGQIVFSRVVPSVACELFYSLIFPKRIVHVFRRVDMVPEYLNQYDFISWNCDKLFDYKKKERSGIVFWFLLYLFLVLWKAVAESQKDCLISPWEMLGLDGILSCKGWVGYWYASTQPESLRCRWPVLVLSRLEQCKSI